MTTIVETLIETATADTELLVKNAELGDNASVCRNVDFLMYADSKKTADLVANFITDFRYGSPSVKKAEKRFQLTVTVATPTTQEALLCISGFMACIASIYELEYDGWESDICKGG
jgi:hypothetical protein